MGLKDIVFGLRLDSKQFQDNLQATHQDLAKLGNTRLDELQKTMKQLISEGKSSSKEFKDCQKEMRGLEKISADAAKSQESLSKGLDKAGKSAHKAGGVFKEVFAGSFLGNIASTLTQGVAGAVGNALHKTGSLFMDSIAAGIESNQINAQLQKALQNTFQNPALMNALEETASKASRAFKVEDDDVKQGYAAMIQGGMKASDAMKQTAMMADLAAARGMSMAQAGKVISKVYNGEVEQLKDLGIFLASTGDKRRDAMNGLQAISQTFRGMAAEQATLAAPWEALSISFGEVMESFGSAFIPKITPLLQKMADFVDAFTNSPRFQSILDGFTEKVSQLFNMAMGLVQSIDFNNLGSSLWGIVKELASFLFDMLVTAGDAIGQKIRENLPAALGGGKSTHQEYLDKAWAKYGNMTPEQQKSAMQGLQKEKAESGFFGRNETTWRIGALNRVMAGQRMVMDRSIGDVINEHSSRIQGMVQKASGGSFFTQMANAGQQSRQAAVQEFAQTAPVIGYSERAAAMVKPRQPAEPARNSVRDAQRQAKAAAAYGLSPYGSQRASRPRMDINLNITSMDSHINPLAAT